MEATTAPENFAFVMNVASLENESYELAPGHMLRRATPEEVLSIKTVVDGFCKTAFFPYTALWEARSPLGGKVEILPESEWRYFVISFRGSNSTLHSIQAAADLAPVELEVGFTVLTSPGWGLMMDQNRLPHVLEHAGSNSSFFVYPTTIELQTLTTICSGLMKSEPLPINVKQFAIEIGQLKGLPHNSPLRFLGYFAVLESLLTHKPKPTDPYDSITRQVKKKIALLDNRWIPRIDYGPFKNASAENVWGKMYDYRSSLAHGSSADFTKELSVLKNHEQALQLIKDTVKAVIRQALIEPRLLLDLREC